MFTAKNPMQFK